MKNIYLICTVCLVAFSACSSKRNLVYFSDLKERSNENTVILNDIEPKIQESDLLNITVNTQSVESNVLFAFNSNKSKYNNSEYEREGYRVNKKGEVNFPVLGKVDGNLTMVRMNLNKQKLFQSPYFYLKQNDVVYVEPDKSKVLEYNPNNRLMPLVVATKSAVLCLLLH